jgi:hypothetical protein
MQLLLRLHSSPGEEGKGSTGRQSVHELDKQLASTDFRINSLLTAKINKEEVDNELNNLHGCEVFLPLNIMSENGGR